MDIKWEAAYAKAFNIEVSCDGKTYKEVASVTNNQNTSTSNKFASVEARYVRVYCTKKATKYGYSIYEVSVYNERPTMENVNLAVNKQATCSSVEYGTDHIAKNAVDGTRQTRWASEEFKDNPEWLQVDLGCVMTINEVYINWEAAYAKAFNVEVSCDGKTYTKVAKVSNNTLLDTYIKFDVVDARYVRVNCTKKATKYGYSIYEFGVYNSTQVIDQIEVTDEEKELLDLVNKVRREEGLCELRFNSELRKCAMLKAQDMVDNGYFDHESPTYGSPFDMMKKFGISYRSAGENIAGARSVERAFELWMNSPGHRANILKESFNQVGFGIVNSPKYGKMLVQQFIGV